MARPVTSRALFELPERQLCLVGLSFGEQLARHTSTAPWPRFGRRAERSGFQVAGKSSGFVTHPDRVITSVYA